MVASTAATTVSSFLSKIYGFMKYTIEKESVVGGGGGIESTLEI